MEFSDIFKILSSCLGDGSHTEEFFHDFMSMITKLKPNEWNVRDPGNGLSKSSICRYVNRGIPKKLARNILYSFTPEFLLERINHASSVSKIALLAEMQKHDSRANEQNLANVVLFHLVECLQISAGLTPLTQLQKQIQERESQSLKSKYGMYLLHECMNCCPVPSCGRELLVLKDERVTPVYEVSLIDKKKSASVDSLIAMCPQCFATYKIDSSNSIMKELKNRKKILRAHAQTKQVFDKYELEMGISRMFKKLKNLKKSDLKVKKYKYDPLTVGQKIDEDEYLTLNQTVYDHVNLYYSKVREILVGLDKSKQINYRLLQNQIACLYANVSEKTNNKDKIYEEIADFIYRKTLEDRRYCYIVVSYFIQNCEVFDATP